MSTLSAQEIDCGSSTQPPTQLEDLFFRIAGAEKGLWDVESGCTLYYCSDDGILKLEDKETETTEEIKLEDIKDQSIIENFFDEIGMSQADSFLVRDSKKDSKEIVRVESSGLVHRQTQEGSSSVHLPGTYEFKDFAEGGDGIIVNDLGSTREIAFEDLFVDGFGFSFFSYPEDEAFDSSVDGIFGEIEQLKSNDEDEHENEEDEEDEQLSKIRKVLDKYSQHLRHGIAGRRFAIRNNQSRQVYHSSQVIASRALSTYIPSNRIFVSHNYNYAAVQSGNRVDLYQLEPIPNQVTSSLKTTSLESNQASQGDTTDNRPNTSEASSPNKNIALDQQIDALTSQLVHQIEGEARSITEATNAFDSQLISIDSAGVEDTTTRLGHLDRAIARKNSSPTARTTVDRISHNTSQDSSENAPLMQSSKTSDQASSEYAKSSTPASSPMSEDHAEAEPILSALYLIPDRRRLQLTK